MTPAEIKSVFLFFDRDKICSFILTVEHGKFRRKK